MSAGERSSFPWLLRAGCILLGIALSGCAGTPEFKHGPMLPRARQLREGSPQARDELELGLKWILEQSRLRAPADSDAIPLTLPEHLPTPEQ